MAYKQKNFFEFRDSLPKGEPDKVIKGMHFDEEFAAIEDAFSKVTGDIDIDGKPLPELLDEKADKADLEQEIKDRIKGDEALQDQINALDQNKADATDLENLAGDLAQEIKDREEGDRALQGNINDLADDLAQEVIDRQNGDSALDKRIDELATDDLADVNSANATKDQFLIHNGSQWIAEDFHLDTELTFQGGISVPNDPAPAASNGDLYINNEDGVVGSSWTGIAGRTINTANAVGWSAKNNRWYMLGDIASAAVLKVEAGTGIDVDASKPAEPVVSIDRTEVDKWYEPPIDPKRTAFNKNFGTTAGTVAEGNHNHDGDYADINHNHSGVYEPVINPKNTAFNKNFGTTAGTVAEGNHTHSQYLTDFTETDPTVPDHVKDITQNDINNWNNAASGGAYTLPLATNGIRGGVQVGYTTSGKNYAVQLSGEKMYVNVPWTDTPTDLTGYATQSWVSSNFDNYGGWNITANGASSSKITANGTVDFKGGGDTTVSKSGNTITISSTSADGYTLPLATNGTRGGVQVGYATSGKNYAVQLSGEKMYVNVPWENTQGDFDKYTSWNITANGTSSSAITSGATLDFRGSGDTTVSKSGNTITISSSGGGGLPAGDWHCDGNITATGNITAYSASDERLKDDIAPMPLGLIDGIAPATFKWKESGKSSGGVIAQQLQACGLEDWVNEGPDETLGVDYTALIGVLLAEVQDLKLRVKGLENDS